MRRALFIVALAACSEPAADRAERDERVGFVETERYRLESPGGLLHVKRATADEVTVRASCAELSLTLERKDPALAQLDLVFENVLPGFQLLGPAGTLSRAFLEPRWRVRFPDGVDRLELSAPVMPSADFTFLAFGDIQTGIRNFGDVVAKLNEHPDADFILFLGDLTNDSEQAEFDAIDEAFAGLNVPVFATPGNHDVKDLTAYQQRYGRTSYSCTHKGARFTAIDSSSATLADALWPKYQGWLELGREQLHVVFSHIPATEVLGVRSGQWNARREAHRFTELSQEGGVDLLLFGHIHSFDAYTLGKIPAFISGGGGAIPERFDGIDRHFLKVRVQGGTADVEVVRVDP